MRLEQVTATIRPRTPVEAMDLGVALVRAFYGPVLRAWLLVFAPVVALAWWGCGPGQAALLIWWLKPVYDKLPLFVLSRALFGTVPTLADTVRALPRLVGRRLILSLTVFRLSPTRALTLPVHELEGLSGGAASARKQVLLRAAGSPATGLFLACQVLEQCLCLAAVAVLFWYSPSELGEDVKDWFASSGRRPLDPMVSAWLLGSYVFAVFIVEPLYVAGGFALYLNRRTILEGWDVELAFRRLTQRVSRPAKGAATVTALLLALLLVQRASAQDPGGAPRDPKQVAEKVLSAPEFSTKQKVWRQQGSAGPRGFGASSQIVGPVVQVLLWTSFAAAVVAGIWLLLRGGSGEAGATREAARPPPPKTLFGLDLREETLPDDPAAAALALFDAGDVRGACALLYRASLARLIAGKALALRASSTEGECLELVRGLAEPELAGFFERLTRAWQQVAYAHSAPPREVLVSLCVAYPKRVGPR